MITDEVIELGGTLFRVEVVSPTYTVLHPVDDPLWLLRFCEILAPREKKDET